MCIDLNFTKIFFSYSIDNVFFKKLVTKYDANIKLTSYGIVISNKKLLKNLNFDNNLLLELSGNSFMISDSNLLFNILNLDINKFNSGFEDEFDFLEFLKESKNYNKVSFRYNSGFIHDLKRLNGLNKILDKLLIIK